MVAYTDVMVDIETTSTQPDRGAILQIAAVKFNRNTGDVSPDFFNQSLDMPPWRTWSDSTRNWWLEQKEGVLREIMMAARPWQTVMFEFQQWALPVGHLRFWSKPSHFDFMFISSYFADLGVANPFAYREATDMNSYLRGLYAPANPPSLNVPFVGDAHNALADTLHQLKVLFAHMEDAKDPTIIEGSYVTQNK